MKKNLVVFCGSRFPNLPTSELDRLKSEVAVMCKALSNAFNLVYGGGDMGLMGWVANEFLKNKCSVTGIIPSYLNNVEIQHQGITETQVVDDLHQRKAIMEHLGDIFLVLPGGLGTLDELCEVLTLQSLNRHQKLICIWNWENTFDGFLQFVQAGIGRNFISGNQLDGCLISTNLNEITEKLLLSDTKLG